MDIDAVNYAMLTVIDESEEPLWKKRIHNTVKEQAERLPGNLNISVQTVGRRIDKLHDEGYLSSCIAKPAGLKRDLIIAYKLTDQGVETLSQKREALLREYVAAHHGVVDSDLFDGEPRPVLLHLLTTLLDLNGDAREEMGGWPTWKLSALAQIYCLQDTIVGESDAESIIQMASDMNSMLDGQLKDVEPFTLPV